MWSARSSTGLPNAREMWTYWSKSSKGPQRRLRHWSLCPTRRGRESWDLFSVEKRRLREDLITVCE